jgi:hypothetical protein
MFKSKLWLVLLTLSFAIFAIGLTPGAAGIAADTLSKLRQSDGIASQFDLTALRRRSCRANDDCIDKCYCDPSELSGGTLAQRANECRREVAKCISQCRRAGCK